MMPMCLSHCSLMPHGARLTALTPYMAPLRHRVRD